MLLPIADINLHNETLYGIVAILAIIVGVIWIVRALR